MNKQTYRLLQLLLFTVSLAVFLASLYFQFIKGLHPCPLCVMQRVCVILAVIFCLTGFFSAQKRLSYLPLIFQLLTSLGGLYFAGRQLWLQSLPPEKMPACLPGLDVLFHYFPLRDILNALIFGAADCGEITWQWLGLSMAGWSVLYFAGLFVGVLIGFYILARCRELS